MYDLHTVPRGYRLPLCFRWGSTLVWPDEPPVVTTLVVTGGDPSAIRKGFKTDRVVLALDTPSERIVLDAAPGATIEAKAFRYNAAVASVSATTSERTLLDFGSEADLVVVEGSFALAGIVPLPLDPALDPDEPVPSTRRSSTSPSSPQPPTRPGAIAVTSLLRPRPDCGPWGAGHQSGLRRSRGRRRRRSTPPPSPTCPARRAPRRPRSPPTCSSGRGAPAFHRRRRRRPPPVGAQRATATDTPGWGFDCCVPSRPATRPPARTPTSERRRGLRGRRARVRRPGHLSGHLDRRDRTPLGATDQRTHTTAQARPPAPTFHAAPERGGGPG